MGSGRNEHFVRTDDADLSWRSRRDDTSFGGMEQWTDRRPDGIARSSGRLTGNLNSSDLQTLNSGIPVYSIFTLQ
jgi:hypothetical protein